jgi:hypothetical protein
MVARSYRLRLDFTSDEAMKFLAFIDDGHSLCNRTALGRLHNREWYKEQLRRDNTNINFSFRADQYESVSLYSKTSESWSWLHSQVRHNIACLPAPRCTPPRYHLYSDIDMLIG